MDMMLESDYAKKMVAKGWDRKEIISTFQGAAVLNNLDSIVFDCIDQALLKREMGLKGVLPNKEFNARPVYNDKQQDAVKKIEERLGVNANSPAN